MVKCSAAAASYLSDKIKLVTGAGKQYVLFDYNMCLLTTEIVVWLNVKVRSQWSSQWANGAKRMKCGKDRTSYASQSTRMPDWNLESLTQYTVTWIYCVYFTYPSSSDASCLVRHVSVSSTYPGTSVGRSVILSISILSVSLRTHKASRRHCSGRHGD